MVNFEIEKKIKGLVIGLDEVGRGPLAGPVVSCGCYFKDYTSLNQNIDLIHDSKKLNKTKRMLAFNFLYSLKSKKLLNYKLGMATVDEIDQVNILNATKLSMKRALEKFHLNKATLIIDGNFNLNYKNFSEKSVKKGDQLSLSIAAASIIAKVHRDRLMTILSKKYYHYNWEYNAGYGTQKHIQEIIRIGPSVYHRKSFEPIKSLIHNK